MDSENIDKQTYKEKAYLLIKDAIMFNKFRVEGIYSQDDICNEIEISKTPVREALLQLQNEGFVKILRGKGVQIVPVNDGKAKDILETRLLLETNNAYFAATVLDKSGMIEIKKCLDDLESSLHLKDSISLYVIDHAFHKSIAKGTKNEIFYKQTCLILDNYLRFENKNVYNNLIDGKKVFEEHKTIAEAIFNRDCKNANKSMKSHLIKSYNRTLKDIWEKSILYNLKI
ncbi:GntR family transcriptional regulator [Peptoniphilus sp. AGMB00490]|uniref:GntR family transcriptional regulator n=1 Tax=Peptoniphilus faecalis TaxID=2731255 RepID=A0A848RK12_9FIRM|nr:GntR family transcriptional regulator [Peptoniphilus faecalis]NMW85769.1 GntR family transcriptional regulator [Peptoniphilus faecalis]